LGRKGPTFEEGGNTFLDPTERREDFRGKVPGLTQEMQREKIKLLGRTPSSTRKEGFMGETILLFEGLRTN